ncbi:MAG: hypothetical protein ACE5OZ_14955 [Candidatus Heimdallarchaeota archaeon]
MAATTLADLVGELSIKSGLSKNEIRRWVMALQKKHPSHPTVERAASMVAEIFGISKESAIRNQGALDVFFAPEKPKNGKLQTKRDVSSAKDSKARIKSSASLVSIAEDEIQRLTRFLLYLEKTASIPRQSLFFSPAILHISCPQCGTELSVKMNPGLKDGPDGLKRVSIPHNGHVLTALLDDTLKIRRFQISDVLEPLDNLTAETIVESDFVHGQ